ncbi:MAG: hypothetical protein LBT65_01830 [Synergistaceae bacterium]|nr:hypothetical protein [Synergistaceae bacterium]
MRSRYGERLDINVVDPRNAFSLWDNIRFRVRASRPTWVLNRKKFCDGIPSLTDLENAIDAHLQD